MLIVIVKIILIIYILRWYARRNARMAAEAAQAGYPTGNQYGGYPPQYWQHSQSGEGHPNAQYGQANVNGYGPGYANGINPNVKGTTQQAELAPPSYDHEIGYGRVS